MTSGEWSCLISFAWAPLTCSERRGSEKFKMEIYVSSRIRTRAIPRQVTQRFKLRPLCPDENQWFNVLQDNGIQINKPLRDNTCQIDYGYMCRKRRLNGAV